MIVRYTYMWRRWQKNPNLTNLAIDNTLYLERWLTIHHNQRLDQLVKVTITTTIFQNATDGSRKHGVEIHEGSIKILKIRKEKKMEAGVAILETVSMTMMLHTGNSLLNIRFEKGDWQKMELKRGRSSAKTALHPFCHII